MIGRLTGQIVEEDADGTVILDVAGVGYEVTVPLGTLGRARGLRSSDDGRIQLFVHTHVREDALVLFGFATQADRAVFRTLMGVSGVGPKLALAILSVLSASELARAVNTKDAARLVGVPGVGKKTAERLLLELRDKLKFAPEGAMAPATVMPTRAGGAVAEQVIDALTRMGFKASEAERAVASLAERLESEPLDVVFREALTLLRR